MNHFIVESDSRPIIRTEWRCRKIGSIYKLQIGLSAHAYLTAIGKVTSGEDTTMVLPSITALAQ